MAAYPTGAHTLPWPDARSHIPQERVGEEEVWGVVVLVVEVDIPTGSKISDRADTGPDGSIATTTQQSRSAKGE